MLASKKTAAKVLVPPPMVPLDSVTSVKCRLPSFRHNWLRLVSFLPIHFCPLLGFPMPTT